jgi:hypothetical protein
LRGVFVALLLYPSENDTSKFGSGATAFIGTTFLVPYISEGTKPGLINFSNYKYISPGISPNSKYLPSAATQTTEKIFITSATLNVTACM